MHWRIGGYLSFIYVLLLGVSVYLNFTQNPVWGSSHIDLANDSSDPWFLIYLMWWRDSRTAIVIYFFLLMLLTIPGVVSFFKKDKAKSWKPWFVLYIVPVWVLIFLTKFNEAYLASWKKIVIQTDRVGAAASPISEGIEWVNYQISWGDWLAQWLILSWPAVYFLCALAVSHFLQNRKQEKSDRTVPLP